jgi:hypothetical protein
VSPCLFLLFRPFAKQEKLPGKIVFREAQGAFEKTTKVAKDARLTGPTGEFYEANQVEHERRREQGVTSLPRKLQRHRRS